MKIASTRVRRIFATELIGITLSDYCFRTLEFTHSASDTNCHIWTAYVAEILYSNFCLCLIKAMFHHFILISSSGHNSSMLPPPPPPPPPPPGSKDRSLQEFSNELESLLGGSILGVTHVLGTGPKALIFFIMPFTGLALASVLPDYFP